MSGKRDSYDNAMMESFFSTLRAELTELERFRTRQDALTAVLEFCGISLDSGYAGCPVPEHYREPDGGTQST
jgi:transposase InsO family protein